MGEHNDVRLFYQKLHDTQHVHAASNPLVQLPSVKSRLTMEIALCLNSCQDRFPPRARKDLITHPVADWIEAITFANSSFSALTFAERRSYVWELLREIMIQYLANTENALARKLYVVENLFVSPIYTAS